MAATTHAYTHKSHTSVHKCKHTCTNVLNSCHACMHAIHSQHYTHARTQIHTCIHICKPKHTSHPFTHDIVTIPAHTHRYAHDKTFTLARPQAHTYMYTSNAYTQALDYIMYGQPVNTMHRKHAHIHAYVYSIHICNCCMHRTNTFTTSHHNTGRCTHTHTHTRTHARTHELHRFMHTCRQACSACMHISFYPPSLRSKTLSEMPPAG